MNEQGGRKVGLPLCNECGLRLYLWKVFKDISFETWLIPYLSFFRHHYPYHTI